MGRGNNTTPTTNYNTALTRAETRTPEEERLSRAAIRTLDWADEGDFRDPRGGGLFVNYADPAILHRNRELQANAGGQGVYGLGTPDPNYLATVKANQAAENEVTDAAQYESDIQSGIRDAAGVAGDTAKMDLSRRMGILGTTAGIYQQDRNRPKWWSYLLGGISSAGSAFAGSEAGSAALAGAI